MPKNVVRFASQSILKGNSMQSPAAFGDAAAAAAFVNHE